MHSSESIIVSIWNANIIESATARFTAIRVALETSQVSKTLVFQQKFIQHNIWETDVE
jgi:hypothetical protein